MKKGCIGCGALILLILMGGAFYWVWSGAKSSAATPSQSEYTVKRGDITVDVTESGAIEPVRVVEIKSKASGRIAELLVEEGDRISPGQLLAKIDPREVQQQVDQGGAQVDSARASTEKATLGIDMQRKEAQNALRQAQIRVDQLKRELEAQPVITSSTLRATGNAVETARKNLQILQEVRHPQERVESENALRDLNARLEEAQRNFERAENLLAKGYISQQQLDSAKTLRTSAETSLRNAQQRASRLEEQQRLELENARLSLQSAEADYQRATASTVQDEIKRQSYTAALSDLETAKSRLREVQMRELDLAQARAAEKSARSQYQNLLIQFNETDVASPLNGVVTKRYREVGELVMSGTTGFGEGTPIMQVADLAQMRVKLSLNELDVSKVREGMRVEVRTDTFPDRMIPGVVKRIAPAAQSSAQQTGFSLGVVKYTVEVYLLKADSEVKPGMTARCKIIINESKKTLLLPQEAVGKENDKFYILKITGQDANGKPKTTKTTVTLGLKSASDYEIKSGVQEGDKVAKPPFTGPARREFQINMNEGDGERRRERD
ncbi:MAG: HlyD family efflux transporter periplasmic adaptor subunit [Fimbriimonadia bacterium]|nr:HlyD family efflux transporter periplasmic adaptor subunit [Fimbriimonadia bacterium]